MKMTSFYRCMCHSPCAYCGRCTHSVCQVKLIQAFIVDQRGHRIVDETIRRGGGDCPWRSVFPLAKGRVPQLRLGSEAGEMTSAFAYFMYINIKFVFDNV